MTRTGLREVQLAFYWGAKNGAEIIAIPAGDLEQGDLVYNTDTNSLWVRLSGTWKDNDNYN